MVEEQLIECLWSSHTTPLTPKLNRTFAFYQWFCKRVTSSHEHFLWHTNATTAYDICWYAPPTTPRLSSLSHVHVNALVAIPVSTSILSPRYQVLTASLPSENFTCTSENLVYCISSRRCPHLYISEPQKSIW